MSWELSSGGKFDDFTFTVEKASFATDANYNNGQTLQLYWEGTATLSDGEVRPEFTVNFPVGSGWATSDGRTAYHESGDPEKGFHASSIYGRVIARALKEFNLGEVLMSRGEPTQANVWEGLSFRIKRETIEFGSGLEPRQRQMPVEYLGEANGKVAQKAVSGTANPSIIKAKLKKLAKDIKAKGGSHQEFVDQATDLDGVSADDDDVFALIVDEDNGIWSNA